MLRAGGAAFNPCALSIGASFNGVRSLTKVEIFTRATCGYCVRAKRLLEMRGVDFDEISIDGDQEMRATMIGRANGRSTVPQIFINGQHVGGCDDLFELERSGELAGMLAA